MYEIDYHQSLYAGKSDVLKISYNAIEGERLIKQLPFIPIPKIKLKPSKFRSGYPKINQGIHYIKRSLKQLLFLFPSQSEVPEENPETMKKTTTCLICKSVICIYLNAYPRPCSITSFIFP